MNVTYFTGAGASAQAIPIWKWQAYSMIDAQKLLNRDYGHQGLNIRLEPYNATSFKTGTPERILRDITWFGYKALEFGTIDTYAKKLFLNENWELLRYLRAAVSLHLSLIECTEDYPPFSVDANSNIKTGSIDSRYISLFAKILDSEKGNVYLKHDYSFITWNYDLQLQRAMREFFRYDSEEELGPIIQNALSMKFSNGNRKVEEQLINLNGHHGAFLNSNKNQLQFYIDRANLKDKTTTSFLNELSFVSQSLSRDQIDFSSSIRYAWERTAAEQHLQKAKDIISMTHTLVIVGYSFPVFNRTIDRELLDVKTLPLKEIIIQDPFLDVNFFKNEFKIPKHISVNKQDPSQFYVA